MKVRGEKKPPHGFRKGTGAEEASRPSTYQTNKDKSRAKIEAPKHEMEEGPKTEVMTYARMDTTSGIGGAVDTRVTLARRETEDRIDEEEYADHGDSEE